MTKVVGVKLNKKNKIYYFLPNNLELELNDQVIVETEKGQQIGEISNKEFEINDNQIKGALKKVLRIATEKDLRTAEQNEKDAKGALKKARELVLKHKLIMHVTTSEYTFNREQLIFYFLADKRIDFRELVKDLASVYHTRIELHQIGVRDKAKEVGGLGPCGLKLCCSSFLNDFDMVSINMAKNQNIALNPTKINGLCGRLLCCLKYEDETYCEYKKGMPSYGDKYMTKQGLGRVVQVDILSQKIKVDVPDIGVIEVTK